MIISKKTIFFDFVENTKSENLGFYFSFFLHVVILLSAIGLPNFFETKQIYVPNIIPIEIINISEFSSLEEDNSESQIAEIKKFKIKEKKFNSSDNTEIKKIEIKEKPQKKIEKVVKKIIPKKDIIIKAKEKINLKLEKNQIKIENNDKTTLPIKKIEPALKPQINLPKQKNIEGPVENKSVKVLDNKEKKIKKIDSKEIKTSDKKNIELAENKNILKEDKKEIELSENKNLLKDVVKSIQSEKNLKIEKKQIQKKDNFNEAMATMLKDLRNDQISRNSDGAEELKKEKNIIINEEKLTNKEAQLSIGEVDLLVQQLNGCWVAPKGAEMSPDIFVKISAKFNKNKTIIENSLRIVDTNMSKSNPLIKSAMRTLLNPKCSPLKLPDDKYDAWKSFTIIFDINIMKRN